MAVTTLPLGDDPSDEAGAHLGDARAIALGQRARPPFAEIAAWAIGEGWWRARCEFDFGEGGRGGYTTGQRSSQQTALAAAGALLASKVDALKDGELRSVCQGQIAIAQWLSSLHLGPDDLPETTPTQRPTAAFVVTDPATWIARGNAAEEAAIIAQAWRDYPDLPPDRSLEERNSRTRERVLAMRPVHEARRARTERERQERNFAFVEAKLSKGGGDERDIATLRGRDDHGYDWDQAITYAAGWYAAREGWEFRNPAHHGPRAHDRKSADSYERGFTDAGGRPDDVFDAARRTLLAAERRGNQFTPDPPRPTSRPSPRTWPVPTDAPMPVPWSRRLLIIACSERQIDLPAAPAIELYDGDLFRELRARPGHEDATIVVLSAKHGFVSSRAIVAAHDERMTPERAVGLAADGAQATMLSRLIVGREHDDLLIAVPDNYLVVVEAHARALPVCRTLERTQHSAMLQRRQFRTWLDRAKAPGANIGYGHIRWGKVAQGLTARLGPFTARYVGPAEPRGHLIRVELQSGAIATGFQTTQGEPLSPEFIVSSRAKLRDAMTSALRTFGGAIRAGPHGNGSESGGALC